MTARSDSGHYRMCMAVAAPFNDAFPSSAHGGWLRLVVSAIEATPVSRHNAPAPHNTVEAYSCLLFPEDAFSPQSAPVLDAGPLVPRTHGRPLKVLPVRQRSSLPLHSFTHLVAHFLVAFNNVNKHQHLAPCVASSCQAFWHPSLRSGPRHSPTATQRRVSAPPTPPPPPSRPTLTLLRAMSHQARAPIHILLRRLHQGP